MRRLLVTASVAVVLLAGAGCSDDTPDAAVPSGAPSATAAVTSPSAGAVSPSGAAAGTAAPGGAVPQAGGNARSVCDAAIKSGATAVTSFARELGVMLRASADGDREAEEQAQRRAQAALDGWSTALREQAGRATDQRLRSALNDLAK